MMIPGLNSGFGVILFPCSSTAFLMSNVAIIQAIVVKSIRTARFFPGQTLQGARKTHVSVVVTGDDGAVAAGDKALQTYRLPWPDMNFSGSCTSGLIPPSLMNLSGLKASGSGYMLSSRDIALKKGRESFIVSQSFNGLYALKEVTYQTFSITVVPAGIRYPSYTSSCIDL